MIFVRMWMNMLRRSLPVVILSTGLSVRAQVVITGAMRNTLFNGQLAGLVAMDSISRPGTFGLGPLDHLRGELLLWDGVPYVSRVLSDSAMTIAVDRAATAPFFVHAPDVEWLEAQMPDSVTDLGKLDSFLTMYAYDRPQPFAFRISGRVAQAGIHVVDLPAGQVVTSPEEAHRGRRTYALVDVDAELLGFFSMRHKAVFTHHDTNIHVHLITHDRQWMGHLDELSFGPGALRLWVSGK